MKVKRKSAFENPTDYLQQFLFFLRWISGVIKGSWNVMTFDI